MTKLIDRSTVSIADTSKHTPRINLSSIEHVRFEASKLYREARAGEIPTEVATRLAYILNNIRAMLEAEQENAEFKGTVLKGDAFFDGIDFDSLNKEQLTQLENAVHVFNNVRVTLNLPPVK
jgi:hypothetical protein